MPATLGHPPAVAPVKIFTLGELVKKLNRSAVHLRRLQTRFQLPVFEGSGYSEAYAEFLRSVVLLQRLHISEDTLLALWHFEKKLLELLHVDSTGSPTWFLDACGQTSKTKQRLLLSNYDLGVPVPARALQLGLNFAETAPELFGGREMGEDAIRVLNDYIQLYNRICSDIQAELPHTREAATWASRFR